MGGYKGEKGDYKGDKGKGKGDIEADGRQVYVGNLSWETSWQDLKDHMATIGDVEYCDLLYKWDGWSSGAGLVRFKDQSDAEKAVAEMTDTELGGRKIFVREDREGGKINGGKGKGKKGGKKGKDGKGKGKGWSSASSDEWSVWVGPLDKSLTWQDLRDAFSDYGCTHTDVGQILNGENRGYGIVKFASATEAEQAIESVTKIGGETVYCKWDNETFKGKGGKY